MKLTKISNQFDIFLSDEKDNKSNKPVILIDKKIFYRFMNRIYIPNRVYKLSLPLVKELNNLREKYAVTIIDKEYNDLIISTGLDAIKSHSYSKITILDFGCGNGYAGEIIRKKLPDALSFGLDIRRPLGRKLLANYNDFSVRGINERFTYADSFFDYVFSFFVFHFYVSDHQIRELVRVIKPNGILFFNLINSADFEIVERLLGFGLEIISEVEINSSNNSGIIYTYCLTKT